MKFVIKLSGKVLEERSLRQDLCRQITQLVEGGVQLVIVHGGGRQLSTLCKKLAIPVVQYEGRRVTDKSTLEAATMVFSAVNRQVTASLGSCGVRATGLAAFDGNLTRAARRPPITLKDSSGSGGEQTVDFGLVGEIQSVDTTLIETLWNAGFLPVISCLCADSEGQILNINADTLAAELALALGADRLISVSDVDGIYTDPADETSLVSSLSLRSARDFLADGVFLDGMIPKVQTALGVLERGLPAFQVLSGIKSGALLEGIDGRSGTMISQ